MNRRIRWCSIAAALALCACGNKGPLVLPDKPAPTTTPAPASDAAAGQVETMPAPDATTPTAPATPAPPATPVDPDKPAEPLPLEDDE